jgi:hypothetical protein
MEASPPWSVRNEANQVLNRRLGQHVRSLAEIDADLAQVTGSGDAKINLVNRGRRLMAAAFSSSERTRENMLKTRQTVSDLEPGYPVVNELSAVLEKIIY